MIAGANPKEITSQRLSYCAPKRLWELVRRATRPSSPSNICAAKRAIPEAMKLPLIAETMEKKPEKREAVVNRFGRR